MNWIRESGMFGTCTFVWIQVGTNEWTSSDSFTAKWINEESISFNGHNNLPEPKPPPDHKNPLKPVAIEQRPTIPTPLPDILAHLPQILFLKPNPVVRQTPPLWDFQQWTPKLHKISLDKS